MASMLGLASALAAPAALANVSGAIWTTVSDGSEVNFNIYPTKEAVYLNGGPGKGHGSNAPGLVPDGTYVFMVTDPSGETLLSTDPAGCRLVKVVGGVITALSTTEYDCAGLHVTGTTPAVPPYATVQLMPYSDTPNQGGEYKVWMTPLASYACFGNLGSVDCTAGGKHGFIPSESKTDNFKVGAVPDEIDTRFLDFWGNYLDGRKVTWFDTHGASNTKWSYYDPGRVIMHEAHVEAPEIGTHFIQIADQTGCKVGDVFLAGAKTNKKGPQTLAVKITKGMKSKGTFTVFIDVRCDSTQ